MARRFITPKRTIPLTPAGRRAITAFAGGRRRVVSRITGREMAAAAKRAGVDVGAVK